MPRRWALVVAVLLLCACPESGGGPEVDAGGLEAGWDGPLPDTGPRVAPQTSPTPVAIKEWMVAMAVSPDPMRAALEQGTFTYPAPGYDSNNMHWSARAPGKDGSLGSFPAGVAYAVARVQLKSTDRLFLRSEHTYRVWLDDAPFAGDVYGSHRMRVPLAPRDGERLLVLHLATGRGTPEAELWTTTDELYMNEADLTAPDLVVGDSAELCVGLPVLNLTDEAALDVTARVVGSAALEETTVRYPGLASRAVTQVAFELKPKQPPAQASAPVKATLRLESPSLSWIYEREITLQSVARDDYQRRTRTSTVDGSCQYYGVAPPSGYDPKKSYALVLSLHGASVEAINQAKAYSQKDWAFIIAPTNRRPYGFDWEGWGRLDGMEALDHATASFPIDPSRVYLAGHSMGGHGTWHLGVMHPGRFATLGPSAGWGSFYSYTGDARPTGVFARTQAASDTLVYLPNLARRGVYILHGGADTNVPVSEGQKMYQAVQQVTQDVIYHEEPGVDHWWDNDTTKPGTDCVDWDPLFAFMKSHTLDPAELSFDFKTPAPWVSSRHSFVTIVSQTDASKDSAVSASQAGATVTLTTDNVRSMELDGDALLKKGVGEVVVDGASLAVSAGTLKVGPQDGKRPGVHGPFHELFYRPFCFVYPDSGAEAARRYVGFLVSHWSVIGNGHACALPLSRVQSGPPMDRNLIFVGVAPDKIQGTLPSGFSWSTTQIDAPGGAYQDAALFLVFPHAGRLGGAIAVTEGAGHLLFRIQPFTSRLVLPDFMVYGASGVLEADFFDADWK